MIVPTDTLPELIPIKNGKFVVQNTTLDAKKTIHIFDYPIPYLMKRDLLAIPNVTESLIRDSLLKGVLKNRILVRDIIVVYSDIDLIQFNLDQKDFLKKSGIIIGVDPGNNYDTYVQKNNVPLEGQYDGVNRFFYVQNHEKFINNPGLNFEHKIEIFHNGRLLIEDDDYILKESSSGNGFDMIYIKSFIPQISSTLVASYFKTLTA